MYELVFHSTYANAHPWNALPLIDPSIDIDRHFLVWPSKHPRLLDSACACVLVGPSQITINNPAAVFLAVVVAFHCPQAQLEYFPHRHLFPAEFLVAIDDNCTGSHFLKTQVYNHTVLNGPFVPLSTTETLDLHAFLNGAPKN